MKRKVAFLAGFFLSNLLISSIIGNYQDIQTLVIGQNQTTNSKAMLKNDIISNFTNFRDKSIQKLQAYRLAEANYYLAAEVITGKDHKNEIISILKDINVQESEINQIMASYDAELIKQIIYLNDNPDKVVEDGLIRFIDEKEQKINWIIFKTFEAIDFSNNEIETIITNYDVILREVTEKDLFSKIEDFKTKFSLHLYERVNNFFTTVRNFENKIIEYIANVLNKMRDEVTNIKNKVSNISIVNDQISAEVLKRLHNFENQYFALQSVFTFLNREDFSQRFTNIFLEINTSLLNLQEFLLEKNRTIIDSINKNINTIKENLKQKEDNITFPGVWESIVADYKTFLEFKKEVAVIAADTKKINNLEYQEIQANIKTLENEFSRIEYVGVTQAIDQGNYWEIYLSAPDTQKMTVYGNAVGITVAVIGLGKEIYGVMQYLAKLNSDKYVVNSSMTWWKKYRGKIIGGVLTAMWTLFDLIPMVIINVNSLHKGAGITFKITKAALAGLTLGAAISLAATVKSQEKQYLTLS